VSDRIREVAERANVPEGFVRRLVALGALPAEEAGLGPREVRRARLLHAWAAAGLSVETILALVDRASQAVNPYWWLQLVTGLLLILLAFWVSGSDRVYALAQRTYLILFWVGFLALFRGFSQLMLAFSVRHAGEEAAALDPAGPGVGAGQPSTGGAS
jgi:uncharacterized membrane protein HdeD (DUF308 family)